MCVCVCISLESRALESYAFVAITLREILMRERELIYASIARGTHSISSTQVLLALVLSR